MKTASIVLTFASALLLISCSTRQSSTQLASNFINRQHVVYTTKQSYPAKNAKHIAIYKNDQRPLTPYRIIGVATVSKYNMLGKKRHDETLHSMMKDIAASIGGDAVVNVSISEEKVSGNVIQFQRILL